MSRDRHEAHQSTVSRRPGWRAANGFREQRVNVQTAQLAREGLENSKTNRRSEERWRWCQRRGAEAGPAVLVQVSGGEIRRRQPAQQFFFKVSIKPFKQSQYRAPSAPICLRHIASRPASGGRGGKKWAARAWA